MQKHRKNWLIAMSLLTSLPLDRCYVKSLFNLNKDRYSRKAREEEQNMQEWQLGQMKCGQAGKIGRKRHDGHGQNYKHRATIQAPLKPSVESFHIFKTYHVRQSC